MLHRSLSTSSYQMDALDGLRGFAALIVVFSHTSNSGMFFLPHLNFGGIGKSGVFLFFLLSSFLLTLPLLRKGMELFSLPVMSNYWQRRFLRIFPLYSLYLLLGVASTWFVSRCFHIYGVGVPFDLSWQDFLRHMALLDGKGVTWSIAVEFKFYFLLPFIAAAMYYFRSLGFWWVISLLAILLMASQWVSPQSDSVTNDVRLLPYMPIFLIGMLSAFIQHEANQNPIFAARVTSAYRVLGWVGLLGVLIMTPFVFSFVGITVPKNFFHKQFILYALFWSFVLMAAINCSGLLQKFFCSKLLRFYGAISFSIYLFHPIFIKLLSFFHIKFALSAWFVLLASTVAAYISFRLVEGPVSRFRFFKQTVTSMHPAKIKVDRRYE